MITPGGRVGDASSLAKPGYEGGRRLANYVRMIAHALMRKGKTKGQAIQMARGILENWASGRGDVSPKVRAAAIKALAEQKALDAKQRVSKEDQSTWNMDDYALIEKHLPGLHDQRDHGHRFHFPPLTDSRRDLLAQVLGADRDSLHYLGYTDEQIDALHAEAEHYGIPPAMQFPADGNSMAAYTVRTFGNAIHYSTLRKDQVVDGDGDGWVYDGTPKKRPATPAEKRAGAVLRAKKAAGRAPAQKPPPMARAANDYDKRVDKFLRAVRGAKNAQEAKQVEQWIRGDLIFKPNDKKDLLGILAAHRDGRDEPNPVAGGNREKRQKGVPAKAPAKAVAAPKPPAKKALPKKRTDHGELRGEDGKPILPPVKKPAAKKAPPAMPRMRNWDMEIDAVKNLDDLQRVYDEMIAQKGLKQTDRARLAEKMAQKARDINPVIPPKANQRTKHGQKTRNWARLVNRDIINAKDDRALNIAQKQIDNRLKEGRISQSERDEMTKVVEARRRAIANSFIHKPRGGGKPAGPGKKTQALDALRAQIDLLDNERDLNDLAVAMRNLYVGKNIDAQTYKDVLAQIQRRKGEIQIRFSVRPSQKKMAANVLLRRAKGVKDIDQRDRVVRQARVRHDNGGITDSDLKNIEAAAQAAFMSANRAKAKHGKKNPDLQSDDWVTAGKDIRGKTKYSRNRHVTGLGPDNNRGPKDPTNAPAAAPAPAEPDSAEIKAQHEAKVKHDLLKNFDEALKAAYDEQNPAELAKRVNDIVDAAMEHQQRGELDQEDVWNIGDAIDDIDKNRVPKPLPKPNQTIAPPAQPGAARAKAKDLAPIEGLPAKGPARVRVYSQIANDAHSEPELVEILKRAERDVDEGTLSEDELVKVRDAITDAVARIDATERALKKKIDPYGQGVGDPAIGPNEGVTAARAQRKHFEEDGGSIADAPEAGLWNYLRSHPKRFSVKQNGAAAEAGAVSANFWVDDLKTGERWMIKEGYFHNDVQKENVADDILAAIGADHATTKFAMDPADADSQNGHFMLQRHIGEDVYGDRDALVSTREQDRWWNRGDFSFLAPQIQKGNDPTSVHRLALYDYLIDNQSDRHGMNVMFHREGRANGPMDLLIIDQGLAFGGSSEMGPGAQETSFASFWANYRGHQWEISALMGGVSGSRSQLADDLRSELNKFSKVDIDSLRARYVGSTDDPQLKTQYERWFDMFADRLAWLQDDRNFDSMISQIVRRAGNI